METTPRRVGTPDWTDDLLDDEVALIGHSELTDRLLFRVAYNRKMATQFSARLKETGNWLADRGDPTEAELMEAKALFDQREADPDLVRWKELRDRCRAAGVCAWGPLDLSGPRPVVRCTVCSVTQAGHYLPLVRP